MEFSDKPFGIRLKELIVDNGSSQLELAKYVGVKANTVSDWIRKGNSPKIKHVVKIAEYFDVSFDYLYTGQNNIRSKKNNYELDDNEKELIDNFRELPSLNTQIRFLGIANDKMADLVKDYNSRQNPETQD